MKHYKSMLVWVILILLFVFVYQGLKTNNAGEAISFTQFMTKALKAESDLERVDAITVRGANIEGTLRDGTRFTTTGQLKEFHKDLIERGVLDAALDDRSRSIHVSR